MNEPIAELIAQNIQACLETVKVAAGYTADLVVIRPAPNQKLTPLAGKTVCYVSMESMGAKPDNSQQTKRELNISTLTFVGSDESHETPIDTVLYRAASDIEKALTFDHASRTRGGLAQETVWKQTTPFFLTPAPCVVVVFSVQFATQTRNPFTSAYT